MEPETHTPTWFMFLGERYSNVTSGKKPNSSQICVNSFSVSLCFLTNEEYNKMTVPPSFLSFLFSKKTLMEKKKCKRHLGKKFLACRPEFLHDHCLSQWKYSIIYAVWRVSHQPQVADEHLKCGQCN